MPKTAASWMTVGRCAVLCDPHVQGYGATISDFEFAGSSARAAQIMGEWGSQGRHLAHLGLVLDYGYMLSYGLLFALAGFAVRDTARDRGWRRMAKAGTVIPYLALAAACFDAAENVALMLTLGSHDNGFAPPFATTCSSIKWVLIGTAILYALGGLALLLRDRVLDRGHRDPRSHRGEGNSSNSLSLDDS